MVDGLIERLTAKKVNLFAALVKQKREQAPSFI
jgi:hypothetical protein